MPPESSESVEVAELREGALAEMVRLAAYCDTFVSVCLYYNPDQPISRWEVPDFGDRCGLRFNSQAQTVAIVDPQKYTLFVLASGITVDDCLLDAL